MFSSANEIIAKQVDVASERLSSTPPDQQEDLDLISYMVAQGTLTREEIIDNLTETFLGGVDTVSILFHL